MRRNEFWRISLLKVDAFSMWCSRGLCPLSLVLLVQIENNSGFLNQWCVYLGKYVLLLHVS